MFISKWGNYDCRTTSVYHLSMHDEGRQGYKYNNYKIVNNPKRKEDYYESSP